MSCSLTLAVASSGGCASGGAVPAEPSARASGGAVVRQSPPDFSLADARIDALLRDDWENDPDAYTPVGRRDPFRPPPVVVAPPEPIDPDLPTARNCPSARLQGAHLDEVRLEGLVRFSSGGAARATLAGPDGRGSIVAIGDQVTDECAVVRAILEDRVVLAVEHRSQRGELVERSKALPLRAPAEP